MAKRQEEEMMIPVNTTTIPIFPSTHVRSTKNEAWLFKVTDEYLEELDNKRLIERGKKGGLLRRKRQLEVHNAHKREIQDWVARTGFKMPLGYMAIWFYVPMPASWRAKKRKEMLHTVHQNTPDIDNYIKQLFDNIMPRRNRISGEKGTDDRKIHCYVALKVWVDWNDACVKIVEYNEKAFNDVFAHGHPAYC
jgi:Holliday junction resolvase RusA-like endonuclease